MTEQSESLADLRALVAGFRDERDWKQFHRPKDLALSICVEAAELAELFQWLTDAEIEERLRGDHLGKVRDELADVLAYCLSLADVLDIDLAKALREKMARNAQRYPVDKTRGSARKYTDLE